jgi:hypothetical protein
VQVRNRPRFAASQILARRRRRRRRGRPVNHQRDRATRRRGRQGPATRLVRALYELDQKPRKKKSTQQEKKKRQAKSVSKKNWLFKPYDFLLRRAIRL